MSKKDFETLSMSERAALAQQVKSVRQSLGLTQQELATEAGVTRQSIGNIESGAMTPQAKTLLPILEALGIKPKAAVFSAETSQWLAIVGGIMDSLPAERRAPAGQAAVAAVTQELVDAANVRGSGQDVDLHEIDLSKGDFALAATEDNSTVTEQDHPDYENHSQDPEV